MRAMVALLGDLDNVDLWPYSEVMARSGDATVLTVSVHDSQELVGVLRGLLARGLEVTRAHLLDEAIGGREGTRTPDLSRVKRAL